MNRDLLKGLLHLVSRGRIESATTIIEQELTKPDFLTSWRDHASPYEQGFVDGMAKQAQSSVDRAVNGMRKEWVGLTDDDHDEIYNNSNDRYYDFAVAIEAKLRSKNESST